VEIGVFVKLLLTVTNLGLLLPLQFAGVAQLVEHFLAKEDVESSSLFARSILENPLRVRGFFVGQARGEGTLPGYPLETQVGAG